MRVSRFSQENDLAQASSYADLAVNSDRYNPSALTNKGNTVFADGDYEKAAEFYREALRNDSSCTEALYNIGECGPDGPDGRAAHARAALLSLEQTVQSGAPRGRLPPGPSRLSPPATPAGRPAAPASVGAGQGCSPFTKLIGGGKVSFLPL